MRELHVKNEAETETGTWRATGSGAISSLVGAQFHGRVWCECARFVGWWFSGSPLSPRLIAKVTSRSSWVDPADTSRPSTVRTFSTPPDALGGEETTPPDWDGSGTHPGQADFDQYCRLCHSMSETMKTGPGLAGLAARIEQGPAYEGKTVPGRVLEYIKTLNPADPESTKDPYFKEVQETVAGPGAQMTIRGGLPEDVTDRRILDQQIRDTIKQFAQVGAIKIRCCQVCGRQPDGGQIGRSKSKGSNVTVISKLQRELQSISVLLPELGLKAGNPRYALRFPQRIYRQRAAEVKRMSGAGRFPFLVSLGGRDAQHDYQRRYTEGVANCRQQLFRFA